jgi:hypothetical protein
MEMICHIKKDGDTFKVYFFNNTLEMFLFGHGMDVKDWDVYDCRSVFIGDNYEDIADLPSLREGTPAA